ncbi:MAG: prolyl oligopeptidase family serine peptidase [Burkholderiaceae bacterium]|nr:prolyl oligopeptidase family serine peptidase [Burkholderiaceae bacterium]
MTPARPALSTLFTHGGVRCAPIAALACTMLLAGCATAPSGVEVAGGSVMPPAALTMTGVPPVPASLPARIGRYTDFKGAGLADWSPDGRRLLVSFLAGPPGQQRTQLHTVDGPGAPLTQVTFANEPTRSGSFLPSDANLIVFERDTGGSEATQVFRLDLATGTETALTEPGQRCDAGEFNRAGTAVLVTCARLDRSAADRSAGISIELLLIDVKTGQRLARTSLPGVGWFPGEFSPDDRSVLLNRYLSASRAEVWLLDLPGGERRKLLPRDGEPPQFTLGSDFAPDGRALFVLTDRFGEFRQLYRYDPANHRFDGVTHDQPWDVSGGNRARNGSRAIAVVNQGGVGVPFLIEGASLQPRPLALPPGLHVTTVRLSADGRRLAFAAQSSRAPSEVRVIDLDTPGAAPQVWAAADTAGLDTSRFTPIERIEWKSFDGRAISGLIQRPPQTFTGKRPVLIEIHGGPEGQATLGFNGRYNYIVNELGVAFIEPNVRGSTGFGKTFHQLDNGQLREDSVRDIGALLDWIARQPDLDASRVIVQGGSYGGYMANAVTVHYADRIRGAIPAVGISNFVTFLERTESYRRDLRRVEYGDERDPAMRAWMEQIAPVNNAQKIKTPLFVVHGRNDPRVPVQEAEQIAATVAKNDVPVWTMIAENEGHGFAKKENADYLFAARVLFLEKFLLGR